jgi:hypothetical protein
VPLGIDLYCGLGGWTDGCLSEGYDMVGFDNERHIYGTHAYPAQLVIQDVLTLHGSQFKDASLIVASPPCTEFSYMAMPWTRAKQIRRALLGNDDFPEGYLGSRTRKELTALFDACFRIQREASEAAGRHIPMVVENVRGAQEWIGKARWHYGSYYLWGDVPALMPMAFHAPKRAMDDVRNGVTRIGEYGEDCIRPDQIEGRKFGGDWFNGESPSDMRRYASKSPKRKAATAMISKIPFELARHVARVYTDTRGDRR